MTDTVSPIAAFIAQWPSLADFATDAGVSYEAVKKFRARNSIAVDYWPAIIRSAAARGITDGERDRPVDADTLMALHVETADQS